MRIIWDLVNGKTSDKPIIDQVQHLMVLACPELTADTLLDLYPSEIDELWAGFQEVNASFLAVVRRVGLFDTLRDSVLPLIKMEMAKAMRTAGQTLTGPSASLSSTDTDHLSGITATVSS